jgi:cell division septum initiation protein DivIVA
MEQEVIIDIKIDEGKAVERLTAVNKEIADLKQQNKDLAKQIKESGDATGELTKKMVADTDIVIIKNATHNKIPVFDINFN